MSPPREYAPRERLSDQLYGRIFDDIVRGRFAVGAQLPSESEVCDRFGVSRPVVREALLRLRADGLVSSQQGRGTFVIRQPADRIRTIARAQDLAGFLRCLEVRIALEGEAARLAAQRRSESQLEAIVKSHERFVACAEAGRHDPGADLAFHAAIATATGNTFFGDMQEAIHASIAGFMHVSLALTRTGTRQRSQRVLDEHAAIVDAVRAADGERARTAMQHHLMQARTRMVDRTRDR
jgi:GntR family transcriptional repressor for pyruvate dehydrogenase complex